VRRFAGLVAQHERLQRQPSADALELPVAADQRGVAEIPPDHADARFVRCEVGMKLTGGR
jgi:hypothetical protein